MMNDMNGQQQVMGGAIMMSHPEPDMDDADLYCPFCGCELDSEGDCPDCAFVAIPDDMASHNTDDMTREGTLSYQQRKDLPDSDFAYIDPDGGRHFPIGDASHTRNALARLPQSKFSPEIKARIRAKILRAAKKFGIKVNENVNTQSNLLVETEQGHVQILEGYSDGYVRVKLPVSTVDVSNRNGRTYTKELAMKEVAMQFQGRVLGQSKHPQSDPDLLDQFIVWENAMLENDGVEYFVAKVVPTQKGKDFVELGRAGAMIATSRRGTGDLKEGTDKFGTKTKVVNPSTYVLQGIDIIYPGFQSDKGAQQNTIHFESIQSNTEGVNTNMPESDEIVETEEVSVVNETPAVETAPTSAPQPTPQANENVTVPTAASVSVTASTPQNAPVPTEIIENLTSEIQAKGAVIATQNVKLSELASRNATQEAQIQAMTESFTVMNDEILRMGKSISTLNVATQERNQIIAERDELLVKRNKTLAERQKLLVQAHATISERDAVIAERNVQVMQRNMLLAQRDGEIAKLHKELQERVETIAKQDTVIRERDAAVAERDSVIAQERASLQERDAMIAQIDMGLVEKNAEIMALNNQLLAEKVNIEVEKERNKAFQYLFEKVQIEGEKASWFIFNDLRNCATVQEVDEKFEASKTKGIQLIEGVARTAGKAVLKDTVPTDADELTTSKENQKIEKIRPAPESELDKKAKSVARLGGF